MKKQIIITAAALLMAGFQVLYAQKNLVQMTPLPLTGKMSFQYHRVVSAQQTIVVEWQVWNSTHKKSNALFLPGYFLPYFVRHEQQASLSRFFSPHHDVVGECLRPMRSRFSGTPERASGEL